LVAVVLNAQGVAITSTTVSWVVTRGGGSVFSPATGTNQSGQTQNIWTLGTIAGNQTVEVRWVDSSTGAAVVIGNFVAKADPGALISITLDSSATQVLGVGQTAQVLVSGEDEFGNSVSPAQMPVEWSSTDPATTIVDPNGLMTGVAGGSATIEARVDTLFVEVKTGVNDAVITVYATCCLEDIAGGGGRLLAASGGFEVYAFTGSSWQLEFSAGLADALSVLSTGVAIAAGRIGSGGAPIFISSTPPVWGQDLGLVTTEQLLEVSLTDPVNGQLALVAHQRDGGGASSSIVFHRDVGGTWTELPSPSPGEGVRSGHSLSANEIYVCHGGVQYWNGASWSPISSAGEFCEGTDVVAGVGYARQTTGADPRTTGVVSLSGGVATPVAGIPAEDLGDLFTISVGPDSRLVLGYFTPNFNPDFKPSFRWQDSGGLWQTYWLPDNWRLQGGPWVDRTDGTIWLPATRGQPNPGGSTIAIRPN
jgi:hypothetical protein